MCFGLHLHTFQTFADTFYRSIGHPIISLPSPSSHTINPELITVSPLPCWLCYPTSYSSCPLALSQWGNYFKLQAYSSSLKVGEWGAVIFMFTGENNPNSAGRAEGTKWSEKACKRYVCVCLRHTWTVSPRQTLKSAEGRKTWWPQVVKEHLVCLKGDV